MNLENRTKTISCGVWRELSPLLRHTSIQDKKVLDIGSGIGAISYWLSQNGAKVVAAEPNYDAMKRAKTLWREERAKIACVRCMGENLPFRENSFDIIIAFDVLDHVRDPERLLAEIQKAFSATISIFTLQICGVVYTQKEM